MSVSTLNARIVHKNDTEENWNKLLSFVPKKGQIIIYNRDADHPAPRFKIGDGNAYLIDLPFVSGTSQDQQQKWDSAMKCFYINDEQNLEFVEVGAM